MQADSTRSAKAYNLGEELKELAPPVHPTSRQFTPPESNYPMPGIDRTKTDGVKRDIGDVALVMQYNLDDLMERGETLHSLNIRSGTGQCVCVCM